MPRFTKFRTEGAAISATSATREAKVRRVIEVSLLPGVSYENAVGWLSDVDIQLIEQGVYGTAEIRKFLIYEKGVREHKLR